MNAVGEVAPIGGRPGPVARNMSMATRLALVVLFVALVSLLVTSLIAIDTGETLATDLARGRMSAAGASRADEVERYLGGVVEQTVTLAGSPMTLEAVEEFSAATAELDDIGEAEISGARADVTAYYRDDVIPPLAAMRGETVPIRDVMPARDAAVYLQHHYLASSPSPGSESAVDDPGDGSTWTEVHTRFHPTYRDTIEGFGIEDLYLIDADSTVVYSVAKGVELGTALDIGPLSGSTLATLARRVLDSGEAGTVMVADLAPYPGAADAPVGFVAAPITDGARTAGVLALPIPTSEVSAIMTGDGNWEGLELGETGEVFLAGSDQRLRSEARRFLQSPDEYLDAALAARSITSDNARRIAAADTSVYFQRVAGTPIETSDAADGVVVGDNYVGDDSRATIERLDVEGFDWFVVSTAEVAQLDADSEDYVTELVVGSAVFVVALTFVAVAWANRTVEPIRAISRRLRLAQGVEARGRTDVPPTAPRDFRELAENFDAMVATLAARRADVTAAHDERRGFLERFLPAAVARRVEDGDRQIIDQVPNATVVVLLVNGLAALVEDDSDRELLDDTIDAADRMAADHGLERVKLSANSYVAACGVSRPYLDQTPRGLAFATGVVERARAIGEGTHDGLSVAVGIDSGPVTYGLSGPHRLVFDAWGPTVSTATRLAQLAGPGQIVISSAARQQLPDEISTEALGVEPDAWLLAARPVPTDGATR